MKRFGQRWRTWMLIACLSWGLIVTLSPPAHSQSWLQMLFQGVQVLQLSNLSPRQEVHLGQQINQQLFNQGQFRPVRNRPLNEYINEIGQHLAQNSDRPDLPYTFQVVNDRAINAFATMGGFVYINTGTILAADNEAELASVIAHEIGHITARHSVTRMRDMALSQGLMTAAGLQESTIVKMGVQLAVNLPMSREAEMEADQLGLKMLTRAGYAPIGMVNFMKKLQSKGGSPPEILSSHPDTQNRVIALQRKISPEWAEQGAGLDSKAYKDQLQSFR
ncbi:MAG: M48 family metallopeptidase [Merismopediaceae bacterium]|nr:M48 family metallopeptidase [Merismopediaceae bacterium]